MRPNQVMFIYKPQLKDVKSRKETTLQISARNTNSRKIAANTVFSVLGNSDVQRGLLKIRVMACGSECRRFESVRAPKIENMGKLHKQRGFPVFFMPKKLVSIFGNESQI